MNAPTPTQQQARDMSPAAVARRLQFLVDVLRFNRPVGAWPNELTAVDIEAAIAALLAAHPGPQASECVPRSEVVALREVVAMTYSRDTWLAGIDKLLAAHPDPQPQGAEKVTRCEDCRELVAADLAYDEAHKRVAKQKYPSPRLCAKLVDASDRRAAILTRLASAPTPPPEPVIECRCSLRTKLVGDGCAVCNPELAAYYAEPVSEGVTKAAITAALDAQPFTAKNSAGRVWQYLAGNGEDADVIMAAALRAAFPALIAERDGMEKCAFQAQEMAKEIKAQLERAEAERDGLKLDRDAWRDEAVEAKRVNRNANEMIHALHREARENRNRAERAEAALREAEKDRERIDWLSWVSRTTSVYMDGRARWNLTGNLKLHNLLGNNFRAAIDAARQQEKGK